MQCIYAKALLSAGLLDDPSISARQMAVNLEGKPVSAGKSSVITHRAGKCSCSRKEKAEPPFSSLDSFTTGRVEVGPEGGEFQDVKTDAPITDWTDVFVRFNLDPELFVIVDDTVRMSTWQQSKALEDGTRDVVNLFSYRARFTRKVAGLIDYESLRDLVRSWEFPPEDRAASTPCTYVVGLADLQLGKGEGDGTPGTLRRLEQSLANVKADIERLHRDGILPKTLLLANMGDHIENVYSSYANQAYTTDLNVRDQINLALEVNLRWLRELSPYFDEIIYVSCLCNHGQLSRNGGKSNVSDDADNATGLIGDTLETICALQPDLARVQFITPRDEMITLVETSGVSMALAHGHKISGNEQNWLAKQSQNLVHTRKFIVDIWFTAHKHHANLQDMGPYTRIQATTSDPGSKYFEDMTGQYSRSGVTVFLVGKDLSGLWSEYKVL